MNGGKLACECSIKVASCAGRAVEEQYCSSRRVDSIEEDGAFTDVKNGRKKW